MRVNLTACAQTDVGLVRKSNEDAFVVADLTGGSLLGEHVARFEVGRRGVLLAVSDGMGGHQAGEVASAIVIESLRRSMGSQAGAGASDTLLEKATIQANLEVWQAAHHPGRENMGATLTALFVHDASAYIAEVGDSRAYVLRGGQIEQVTRDQSFVQSLVDCGAMTPSQAKGSRLSNLVLQAMGLGPEVSVALGRVDLRQHDCLVLCSDGLSNELSAEEMRRTILASPGLDAACANLIDEAKRRGGDDNITAIVAGVDGDLPPAAFGESIAETLHVIREFQPPEDRR